MKPYATKKASPDPAESSSIIVIYIMVVGGMYTEWNNTKEL